MTTPDPTVGNAGQAGAADANQSVSPTPEKPIDGDAIKLLTELGGKYETLVKEVRGLQGRQDKSDKQVGSFQEQLARFNQIKAQGNLSDEQALETMQRVDEDAKFRDEMRAEMRKLAERVGGIGSTPTEQQMVAEVLSEFKLDPKDPYVAAQFQGKQFANRTEAEAWAGRVLLGKTTSPQPNQAQAASLTGTATAPGNPDEQFARLEFLYRDYTANKSEIEGIEGSLKAAGHMK